MDPFLDPTLAFKTEQSIVDSQFVFEFATFTKKVG